jgi:Type IV secretion-system coupling protein DNA-binding domain
MAPFIGNPLTLGLNLGSGRNLVSMTDADRARHLYIVGATRTGKSKQLEDCVRQDILAWPRSGCGALVIDRHGSLYDNLIAWAAAQDLSSWPIVPIDLRRSDWIVSYNPLRRRGGGEDPAVVVGNFVRSILHSCGQSRLDETPRLVKWLEGVLLLLHEHNFTLAEALRLIASPDVRGAMTGQIEDLVQKSIWQTAPTRESDFQEVVESTVNRVRRFLSRRVMRATLGQSEVSLDLGAALEEGQIVLVSTATEGAKIDEEDASTFGSLLLSDLWLAARARGKREEGFARPYYVYLDEFQEYLTPAMAETLDQASGFGLHMTLAHQFPSQLLRNEQGRQVYNSVMANCRNKIVFHLEHNEDVEAMALMLYRQEVDPYKVKNEIWSTRVLGHEIQYFDSHSEGVNTSVGGGTSRSITEGVSHTTGTNWSHTDGRSSEVSRSIGVSLTDSRGDSITDGVSNGHRHGTSLSRGSAEGTSESESSNWSDSQGTSRIVGRSSGESWSGTNATSTGGSAGSSKNRSQTHHFGRPSKRFQKDLEEYMDGDMEDEAEEDKFKRRASGYSLGEDEGETEARNSSVSSSLSLGGSRGSSESDGESRAITRGGGTSRGRTFSHSRDQGESEGFDNSESRALAHSTGSSLTHSHGLSVSEGVSESDTYGGSETYGESTAWTDGVNSNWTEGESRGVTSVPMLIPVLGEELSSITYESIDEQLFRFAQYLAGQDDRHCVVKLVSRMPVSMVTLTVKAALTTPEWANEWATLTVQGLGFALPMDVALANIEARQRGMLTTLLRLPPLSEPASFGRPVPPGLEPPQTRMLNRKRKPRS